MWVNLWIPPPLLAVCVGWTSYPFRAIQDCYDDEDFDVFDVDNGGDDGVAEADADDVDHH